MSGSRAHLVVITGLPGSGKTTLATALADQLDAVRFCPDEWMMAAGIDLWDSDTRARIEAFQHELALDRLERGRNVVIEWGVWTRAERNTLRDEARAVGATVELRYTSAPIEELWRRIGERDREGHWGARPIERQELEEWAAQFEPPTEDEIGTYDAFG